MNEVPPSEGVVIDTVSESLLIVCKAQAKSVDRDTSRRSHRSRELEFIIAQRWPFCCLMLLNEAEGKKLEAL